MSVKHALLALLFQRPMHGYELGKSLSLTLKTDWDVKPGQIASTLARLEEGGLVIYEIQEADGAPDRKVYQLTSEGERELTAWYLTPEIREYRLGDNFYLKLVFSLINAPVAAEQVLMMQRRRLYQELHDVMDLRASADTDTELPWLLMLETVVMHLEADIRWIEMCEARLPDLKRYRPPELQPQPRGRPRTERSKEGEE
jgi:DNA-binding PadR family transcriptional regulator